MTWVKCHDAQPESSSESSGGPWWDYRDLFESDDDDDSDSESYEEFIPHLSMSPVPLPNEVGEGIQLRKYPQQTSSRGDTHILREECHYTAPHATLYRVDKGIQGEMREGAKQMANGYQHEDEHIADLHNDYERHSSSPTWLPLVTRVDEAIQGDTVQCCDKQNKPSSESSEGPRWEYGDLVECDDDYSGGYEECFYSPILFPASLQNEGSEDIQLERDPQQMPSRGDDHILHEGCRYSATPPTLHRVAVGIQREMRQQSQWRVGTRMKISMNMKVR